MSSFVRFKNKKALPKQSKPKIHIFSVDYSLLSRSTVSSIARFTKLLRLSPLL